MMILKQLFDKESSTLTYLIASAEGREGIIIDPVIGNLERYTTLIDELGLKLVMAIDTHTHADHISARCALHHRTECHAVMGEYSSAECVSLRLKDSEKMTVDGLSLVSLYTPGHTDDSYCFLIDDTVFTGDTLFIRGTGRTDFQNGNAESMYQSITEKLFTLPSPTVVYPGHDYNGNRSSSIAEECKFNPRLAGKSKSEFVEIMQQLNLAAPKEIDSAVPANLNCQREKSATSVSS